MNIGPDAKGRIPELAEARLRDISEWMAVNSEAVYGTKPVAKNVYNGYVMQKNDCIYLLLKKQFRKNVLLYIDPQNVVSVSMLTSGGEKQIDYKATYGNGISITLLSEYASSPFMSVIKVRQRTPENKSLDITD